MFRTGPENLNRLRSHHLHLIVVGGGYWRRTLAFRDELRRNPAAAAEHEAVNGRLLATCGGDSRAYTRGKHHIVKAIERAAGVDYP